MADWILVPCLVQLRSEFNAIAPKRDKASDGSIGDPAHAEHVSDHNPDESGRVPIRDVDRLNEVHAIDVDKDLRTPGLTMEEVVQFLLFRCRMGLERRLRYIIWNRRIWEASNDWRQRTYTGANPHDKHAHFSASYNTVREASKAPWELAQLIPKPAPPKEQNVDLTKENLDAIAKAVWDHDVDRARAGGQSAAGYLTTENARSGESRTVIEPGQDAKLTALEEKVDALTELIEERLPAPPVEETETA